ncbi:MAG: hypothetical protein H8E86_07205 [Planctomycetes bacterium]|nr:hypothetical protein [Planctomycetota bacterium]
MVDKVFTTVSIAALCFVTHAEELHSVGLENMAKRLQGDVRLIAMGDSYSSPYFARVPLAGLRVWPIEKISAMSSGAPTSSDTFICTPYCNPSSLILSSDSLGYAIERDSSKSFFTLPIFGLQEFYTSTAFDDEGNDTLFTISLDGDGLEHLSSGVHGPFAQAGDDVKFRFLYRSASNSKQQLNSVKAYDGNELVSIMHLRDNARPYWHLGENPDYDVREPAPEQINAYAVDFPARNNTQNSMNMKFEQTGSLAGTNQYLVPAGSVYYHQDENGERETGLYFSYVSDSSWSYYGFGCDAEGNDTHDKRFAKSQFTHWLDVTTLDREQPVVFMWYLAPEFADYSSSITLMTNMIAQAEGSAKQIGITTVEHLIVVAPLFQLDNSSDISKEFITYQQQAAFDIASTTPNVAAASLFSATDEVLFDGPNGIPWLLYHGFDHFEFGTNSINLVEETNGDLFDPWVIHPSSPNAAAFFSTILGEIIRKAGCKADVVADGYINTTDLLAVIGHIGQEYIEEDINEDGIVDIQDLLLVIDGWGACWPIQAPYNTPTFRSN